MIHSKLHITLFALILVVIPSCVTTKKSKEEPGWLGKKIHDVNARYNGYFNAKEMVKVSLDDLSEIHVDNYSQVLTLYPYGTEDDRKTVEENMDIAIEKVVKVAALHEHSKWVDDCYVMMGKAQFIKGDYESAQETLEYFVEDFNPRDPDSRVYQAPDRKTSSKQKKKKQAEERKIQEEERKKEREEKEKDRKQLAKERKKAREQAEKERKQRNKDRKRGKRTSTPKKEVAQVEIESEPPAPQGVAGVADDIPLDPDEEYLRDLANKQEKSKNKKIQKGNTAGFMKHKPAFYEGMLWLSKTFIEREKWIEANYFLDKLESEENVLSSVQNELPVVRADFYLKQKDYRNAVPALIEAIDISKDRLLKARMAFILAQAYQMNGQSSEALAAFDKVKKYKASSEMELHANLNKLKNAWASGESTSDQITRKLDREAKQDKNDKYVGSIYSTIAEIKLADGDQTGAMEYFQKALQSSSGQGVKSEIYYRLGVLFFANENYVNAKTYYDSTLQVMSEKDPRYSEAKSYATSLTDIAKNIEIISKQDSLLALGNLSEDQLEKFAKDKAEKNWVIENEEKEAEGGFSATTTILSGNSKFFAYNQVAKQKGQRDFIKRWGNRPLEDDWRRSNKSSSVFDQEDLTVEEDPKVIPEDVLDREIDKIIRNIPRDDEARKKANDDVEKAMFELGTGFRTLINNYSRSNETLLNLLKRYPETKNRPEALYFIYLNFLDLEKPDMAESFKNRLINDFPNSDFAKYLKNPLAGNTLLTDERKIEMYYEATYKLFEDGQYQKVFDRIEHSKTEFGGKHFMNAKYDLLSAMCIGNLKGQSEYINALRGVILKYDNTPEQTYAREMLRFLRGDEESFTASEISDEELSKYKIEDNKLHYVIAILYKTDPKAMDAVKKGINSFNAKNYADKKLRSTSLVLNSEAKSYIVLVRRFVDKNDGMAYYKDVSSRLDEFLDTKKFSYDLYTINQKNYRQVVQEKAANLYRIFFDRNYLGIK